MTLKGISTTAAVLFVLLLALLFLSFNYNRYIDDSFITFRYAQNFAEGYGLRFNPDEIHFGSTAMGLAVFLGGLSYLADTVLHHSLRVTGEIASHGVLIPLFASVLSAASLGLTVGVLFLAGRRTAGEPGAWAGTLVVAAVLLMAGFMGAVSGHETGAYLALLVLAAYVLFFAEGPFRAGMILAVAASFRPDSLLMFVILLGLVATRLVATAERRPVIGELVRLSGGFALLYLPWLLFCKLYFGRALPETMLAKQAQTLLGYWPAYDLQTVLAQAVTVLGIPVSALLLLLVVAALAMSVMAKRNLRDLHAPPALPMLVALLLFGLGQALFYHLIGVTHWNWYLTPLPFTWVTAGGLAAFVVLRHMVATPGLAKPGGAVVVVAMALVAAAYPTAALRMEKLLTKDHVNPHVYSYDGVVLYLREHEPAGCSVATPEPGALGFRLGPDYKVVDELGLISPGVARHITLGDMDYPFRTWNPDYVVVSWPGRYSPHDRPWFDKAYVLVAELPHVYWQNALKRGVLLYKRRDAGAA